MERQSRMRRVECKRPRTSVRNERTSTQQESVPASQEGLAGPGAGRIVRSWGGSSWPGGRPPSWPWAGSWTSVRSATRSSCSTRSSRSAASSADTGLVCTTLLRCGDVAASNHVARRGATGLPSPAGLAQVARAHPSGDLFGGKRSSCAGFRAATRSRRPSPGRHAAWGRVRRIWSAAARRDLLTHLFGLIGQVGAGAGNLLPRDLK